MYFNVNFNVFFKLIKVHLLVSELCIFSYSSSIQNLTNGAVTCASTDRQIGNCLHSFHRDDKASASGRNFSTATSISPCGYVIRPPPTAMGGSLLQGLHHMTSLRLRNTRVRGLMSPQYVGDVTCSREPHPEAVSPSQT